MRTLAPVLTSMSDIEVRILERGRFTSRSSLLVARSLRRSRRDVSEPTGFGTISAAGPLLVLEPVRAPQEVAEQLWIMDGARIPVRRRKADAS